MTSSILPRTRAPFITIEGVDGAGKSSHLPTIKAVLEEAGFQVVESREPGGTELGERLRQEILNTSMATSTEVLLTFASRAEHLAQVIEPALAEGKAVLCDRFTDSTYAYQGSAGEFPKAGISLLEQLIQGDRQPDLTLIFDLPVAESKRRLGKTSKTPDKFESQDDAYFEKVRAGYHERIRLSPQRFAVINSEVSLPEVTEQVKQSVRAFLEEWGPAPQAEVARRPRLG